MCGSACISIYLKILLMQCGDCFIPVKTQPRAASKHMEQQESQQKKYMEAKPTINRPFFHERWGFCMF